MVFLRTLQLNCLLAALLPCLVAIPLLVWTVHRIASQARTDHLHLLRDNIASLAQGLSTDEVSFADLTAWQQGWRHLGLFSLDAEGHLMTLTQSGAAADLEAESPPAPLVLARVAPQAWIAGVARAAAPVQGPAGDTIAMLYGEYPAPSDATPTTLLMISISALLGSGLVMAWYLSWRIYRPIEWLNREAAAALEGTDHPDHLLTPIHSAETRDAVSSIETLAGRYRHSQQSSS